MADNLSTRQLLAISIIERHCSVISLVGCVFTIATFCEYKALRKPIERLIFFASLGRMLSSMSILLSQVFVKSPSSLRCHLQAFLTQM